jgi:hypothetical protein
MWAADKEQTVAAGEFKLSGPYRHENLTIFLVHGEDRIESKKLVTLQEALEQKKAIVHETDNVSELAIENVSKDVEVFIQSGDIVKGGKQDRLISFSMIVAAQSGKVPVAAFCVEQGRWRQRGKEADSLFSSSTSQVPSKALKVAGGGYAQLGGSGGGGGFQGLGGGFQAGGNLGPGPGNAGGIGGFQGGVWKEVTEFQKKLMKNAGVEKLAEESPTSLQLTLENQKVKEAVARYTQPLAPILERHNEVIGYAFAINGKVNSAEVYGSAVLFRKLWPKLLQANATEALAELDKGEKFDPVTADSVKAFLLDVDRDRTKRDLVLIQKALSRRIVVQMQETDQSIFVETRDPDNKVAWIHRTYLMK